MVIGGRVSVVSCQLSVVSCQLSAYFKYNVHTWIDQTGHVVPVQVDGGRVHGDEGRHIHVALPAALDHVGGPGVVMVAGATLLNKAFIHDNKRHAHSLYFNFLKADNLLTSS